MAMCSPSVAAMTATHHPVFLQCEVLDLPHILLLVVKSLHVSFQQVILALQTLELFLLITEVIM